MLTKVQSPSQKFIVKHAKIYSSLRDQGSVSTYNWWNYIVIYFNFIFLKMTWPPCSAEYENACSYTFTPQYFFMAWCLVKHRDNFTFVFCLVHFLYTYYRSLVSNLQILLSRTLNGCVPNDLSSWVTFSWYYPKAWDKCTHSSEHIHWLDHSSACLAPLVLSHHPFCDLPSSACIILFHSKILRYPLRDVLVVPL